MEISQKKIGIIGLSSPCHPDAWRNGYNYLKSIGFLVSAPLDPSASYGISQHLFSASSVFERVDAFHRLLRDPELSVVVAARGGYGCVEVLEHIDYQLLSQSGKLLVGSSDFTALLMAAYTKSQVAGIHGPMVVPSFARAEECEDSYESTKALLKLVDDRSKNPFEGRTFRGVCAAEVVGQGKLIGGNISVIASLAGTEWLPDFNEHVLFLEEVGEAPHKIHRCLMQLKHAGVLRGIRGVLLGSFKNCQHPKGAGPLLDEIFVDIFKPFGVPVLAELPFGHEALNLPVPFGQEVELRNQLVTFL